MPCWPVNGIDGFSARENIRRKVRRGCRSGQGVLVQRMRTPDRPVVVTEETEMTQYLLSVWMVDGAPTPSDDEIQKMYKDVDVFNDKLKAGGSWVFAGGLHPANTATVVRVQDGEVLTTDGPFAETKEQLGGFWVVSAPDLDAALALAAEATVACQAPVEVRPFQDDVQA
jgi:hypothetical protein